MGRKHKRLSQTSRNPHLR